MRGLVVLLAGILGIVIGAIAGMAVQPVPDLEMVEVAPTSTTTDPPLVQPPEPSPSVVLVWTPGSIPPGLGEALSDLATVDHLTQVRSDLIGIRKVLDGSGTVIDEAPQGLTYPLEAIRIEPATYAPFLPHAARRLISGLSPGEVILGSTSARVRGIEEGASLQLDDGRELIVAGVLDDTLVGGAEMVTAHPRDMDVTTARYLLVGLVGDRAEFESAVRELVPQGVPVRVRGPGETPYFRHGDAVLPQAHIKEVFGEFAYRPGTGDGIRQEEAWVDENIVTEEIALLGAVTCHRSFLPLLAGALEELEGEGLGHLVESTAGCWNPRFTRSGSGLSRHAWGAAIDINFASNPTGVESAQDPRLVETMERWGLTWGGFWLNPDPAHFEYVAFPER